MLALQIPLPSTDKEGYAAWMWLNLVHRDGVVIKAVTLFYVVLLFWHDDDTTEQLTALFGSAPSPACCLPIRPPSARRSRASA